MKNYGIFSLFNINHSAKTVINSAKHGFKLLVCRLNSLKMFLKKINAFTLAEISIVLAIVGALSAILVPVAINSMPDDNVMKLKKANTQLFNAINELVSSDKYHLNGDLGIKPDGTLIDGTHDGDKTYFCETFASLLSTKSVNCSSVLNSGHDAIHYSYDKNGEIWHGQGIDVPYKDMSDRFCKDEAYKVGPEIVLPDGIVFYQSSPADTYGKSTSWDPNLRHYKLTDDSIHPNWHKVLCIDIDGIPQRENEYCDDEKDICPFGYGISTEGYIILGERAKVWLNKDPNSKDDESSSGG